MKKILALALALASAASVSACYTPQQQTGHGCRRSARRRNRRADRIGGHPRERGRRHRRRPDRRRNRRADRQRRDGPAARLRAAARLRRAAAAVAPSGPMTITATGSAPPSIDRPRREGLAWAEAPRPSPGSAAGRRDAAGAFRSAFSPPMALAGLGPARRLQKSFPKLPSSVWGLQRASKYASIGFRKFQFFSPNLGLSTACGRIEGKKSPTRPLGGQDRAPPRRALAPPGQSPIPLSPSIPILAFHNRDFLPRGSLRLYERPARPTRRLLAAGNI